MLLIAWLTESSSAAAGAVESPAYRFDWAQLFGTPRQKRQRALSVDAAAAQLRNLLAIVPADDQVDIRSAGGSGAGAFLLPPELPDHKMSDDYLAAAIRRRHSPPPPLQPRGLRACTWLALALQTSCQGRCYLRGLP